MKTSKYTLPESIMVRGYEIKKLHLGAYTQALEALQDAPKELIKEILGTGDMSDFGAERLMQMLMKAVAIVPDYALNLCAKLFEMDENQLKSDREIGLDGLTEMLEAWLEVNSIENFIQAVAVLWKKWATAKNLPDPITGFKGLLLKGWFSASAKKSS